MAAKIKKSEEDLKLTKKRVKFSQPASKTRKKPTKSKTAESKKPRKKYDDFYRIIRNRINDWSKKKGKNYKYTEYLLAAPDLFHLLVKLFFDPDVPKKYKAKISAAIIYFISPVDLIPEALLGPAGFIDDIALAAYVLNDIFKANEKIVRKHWAGEKDILETIEKITEATDNLVGSGVWSRLKLLLNEKTRKQKKGKK